MSIHRYCFYPAVLVLLSAFLVACGSSSSSKTSPTTPDTSQLDTDQDGWTPAQGDCNDNDKNVNPGAVEVATPAGGTPADEDCDSLVDEVDNACDTGLAIDDTNPLDAAKAINLCQTTTATGDKWGVISATYTRANGDAIDVSAYPAQGLLADFGTNVTPQTGSSMLALSSGYARDTGDSGNCGAISCSTFGAGTAPANFPQAVPGCVLSSKINDDIAFEITLKAPSNATGFKVHYNFYSQEWPEWVCTSYNDQFVIIVDPPVAGAVSGNIAYDANGNSVSVSFSGIQVCDPADISSYALKCTGTCLSPPNPYCPLGTSELQGTGFDTSAGATAWISASAPVTGGQIFTVKFIIWDSGDQNYDSTVLIDGWEWVANAGGV